MPVKLDIAQTEVIVVKEEETKNYDSVVIVSHTVDNIGQAIVITYERYMNGVKLVERYQHYKVTGMAFGQIAMGVPDGIKNRYLDTKDELYAALLTGLGLTGVVS